MTSNQNDPVVDEIREIRHRVSERFDHDPARLVAYSMEFQKEYQNRLIEPVAGSEQSDPSAA
jgi:hypothetical protein